MDIIHKIIDWNGKTVAIHRFGFHFASISINHRIELKNKRKKHTQTPPLQAISNLFTVNLFKIIHNMHRRTTNQTTVRQVHGV